MHPTLPVAISTATQVMREPLHCRFSLDFLRLADKLICTLQDDPSGWLLAFVDIITKVLSQYRLLILIYNFQFDVNKSQ